MLTGLLGHCWQVVGSAIIAAGYNKRVGSPLLGCDGVLASLHKKVREKDEERRVANVNRMRAISIAVFLGGMMSGLVMAASGEVDKVTRQEIAERIAPVGEVCVEGQPCATAAPVVSSGGPRAGDKIYGSYCTVCHTAGVLGAPKKGDANAWSQKLAAAGSYSNLLSNAIKGIGSMPPKGTCMDCSDEEMSAAIQYMSGLKP